MGEWQDAWGAPKDGTWILLKDDNDLIVMGRWEPITTKLGSQTMRYEWRVFDPHYEDNEDDREAWNWWPECRAGEWRRIPPPEDNN